MVNLLIFDGRWTFDVTTSPRQILEVVGNRLERLPCGAGSPQADWEIGIWGELASGNLT